MRKRLPRKDVKVEENIKFNEIFLSLSKDECHALRKELEHSFISYENPLVINLMRRIDLFLK